MPADEPVDYLVCYDIRDPKRLRRVHRCMRDWGLRLQYSVFYCRLNRRQRKGMVAALAQQIHTQRDDVRIYTIQSARPIRYMGTNPLPEGLMLESLQFLHDQQAA